MVEHLQEQVLVGLTALQATISGTVSSHPDAVASCVFWAGFQLAGQDLAGSFILLFSAQWLQCFQTPPWSLVFQPERKFGVVVVGVGRAGSVRMRDLRNPHPSSAFLNLIGFVSRWLTLSLCFTICGKPSEAD